MNLNTIGTSSFKVFNYRISQRHFLLKQIKVEKHGSAYRIANPYIHSSWITNLTEREGWA